ncbi:MAG: sensor histidine kinase [Pseudoramibacter sp.]|jgi:signal transduction histidine kinase
MTIHRKLIISNVLMIVIPLICGLILIGVVGEYIDPAYTESVEATFKRENGIYSAQMQIYDNRKDPKALSRQLKRIGYSVEEIRDDGKVIYSNFTKKDRAVLKKVGNQIKADHYSVSFGHQAVVCATYKINGKAVEITAVCVGGKVPAELQEADFKHFIVKSAAILGLIVLLVIALTNAVLTRWITKMIMTPLDALRDGTHRIAEGDLNSPIAYNKSDEFGAVCQDFEGMRHQLKISVDERLRAEQNQREWLAGISHDLRTPLTSIIGYVEGLQDGIANTEEKRARYYTAIHTRADDMTKLVDSLSELAHLQNNQFSYHLKKTQADAFLLSVIERFNTGESGKTVELRCDLNAPDAVVEVDANEMNRVFHNLFENSIKYAEQTPVHIGVTSSAADGRYIVTVCDNGPGVPEADLPHIFDSFYRGDKSRTMPGQGSGLGLAIVRQIVTGHGGTIEAQNNGNGLTVSITLPICTQTEQ